MFQVTPNYFTRFFLFPALPLPLPIVSHLSPLSSFFPVSAPLPYVSLLFPLSFLSSPLPFLFSTFSLLYLFPSPSVESGSLVIPQGPRLAHQVITVKKLGLAFDPAKGPGGTFTIDELKARPAAVVQQRTATSSTTIDPTAPQWLFRNVSFSVQPGQVVGIVGPNGVGKTTILKLLQGLSAPSAGEITTGQSVVFGYNAQTRVALNPENVVWKEITGGAYVTLQLS